MVFAIQDYQTVLCQLGVTTTILKEFSVISYLSVSAHNVIGRKDQNCLFGRLQLQ